MFEDDDSVLAAMRAGAREYLLKDAHQDELVRAVKAVSKQGTLSEFQPAEHLWLLTNEALVNRLTGSIC